MKIDQTTDGGIPILYVAEDVDASGLPALDGHVEELTKDGTNSFVINLRGLRFIDSTALGWLVKTAKALKRSEGELVLAEPSEYFRKVIRAFGIDMILNIFPTNEEALAHLTGT